MLAHATPKGLNPNNPRGVEPPDYEHIHTDHLSNSF